MKKIGYFILVFPFFVFCKAKNEEKSIKMEENQLINRFGLEQKQNKTTDETEILALTRRFTELMIAGNVAELEKIVDKNFTLTHITGYVQPKSEWFKEIQSESMKYYSAKEVDFSLKINGNKAEFVQKNILDARIWGSRNSWRLQQTMFLEKVDNQWVIVKSVAKTF